MMHTRPDATSRGRAAQPGRACLWAAAAAARAAPPAGPPLQRSAQRRTRDPAAGAAHPPARPSRGPAPPPPAACAPQPSARRGGPWRRPDLAARNGRLLWPLALLWGRQVGRPPASAPAATQHEPRHAAAGRPHRRARSPARLRDGTTLRRPPAIPPSRACAGCLHAERAIPWGATP